MLRIEKRNKPSLPKIHSPFSTVHNQRGGDLQAADLSFSWLVPVYADVPAADVARCDTSPSPTLHAYFFLVTGSIMVRAQLQ